MLRSAKTYSSTDKLMQKVTKKAIEKAHKKGDLDAKFRAVENAAALEDVEEQRRDAAAAGEDISTKDATAAFLVAQRRGEDAQEVQERHNAAEDQRTDYKQQIREVGATRRDTKGRDVRVDGDTVRKQQADWAAREEERRARGDTEEARRAAVPDTNHSMGTHVDWVADQHAYDRDHSRKWHKSVKEQLRKMGIASLGDVVEIVEDGSIVGFKVEERLLPSWVGVENPVTTFEKATANAARVREMPGAVRRQSEIMEQLEEEGKPHHCNPAWAGSAKWMVTYDIGGRSRRIRDLETGEHLLENKDAARELRDKYEDHVAEGQNGKCPCRRAGRVCSWLKPLKRGPKRGRRY